MLASLFLDDEHVDGLLYLSVQAEGSPVLVIKPSSIDDKIIHNKAKCLKVNKCFGYAIYYAETLYRGTIINDKIEWKTS